MPVFFRKIAALPTPISVDASTVYDRFLDVRTESTVLTTIANVTGATNATPIVLTLAGLPNTNTFLEGQLTVSGVTGNAGANGTFAAWSNKLIDSVSTDTPISVSTGRDPHGLVTGMQVTIGGSGAAYAGGSGGLLRGNANANGTWTVTVTSPTTFTLNGSGGGTATGFAGTFALPSGGTLLVGSSGNGAYASGGIAQIPTAVPYGWGRLLKVGEVG